MKVATRWFIVWAQDVGVRAPAGDLLPGFANFFEALFGSAQANREPIGVASAEVLELDGQLYIHAEPPPGPPSLRQQAPLRLATERWRHEIDGRSGFGVPAEGFLAASEAWEAIRQHHMARAQAYGQKSRELRELADAAELAAAKALGETGSADAEAGALP